MDSSPWALSGLFHKIETPCSFDLADELYLDLTFEEFCVFDARAGQFGAGYDKFFMFVVLCHEEHFKKVKCVPQVSKVAGSKNTGSIIKVGVRNKKADKASPIR